jgi:hypothetical protein
MWAKLLAFSGQQTEKQYMKIIIIIWTDRIIHIIFFVYKQSYLVNPVNPVIKIIQPPYFGG